MRRSAIVLYVATLLVILAFGKVARSDSCNASGSARVKETEINAPVEKIEWIRATGTAHASTEAIYVITTGGSLYRSGDEGKTWSLQTQPGVVRALALTNDTNKQWFYAPPPDAGKLWNTNNQGLSYNPIQPDRRFVFVQGHPTLPNTALAIIQEAQNNLYVTHDFGQSWTLKKHNVAQASWGQAGQNGVPVGNMLALVTANGNMTFVRTKNYFDSVNFELSNSVAFLYHKQVIFIVRNSRARGYELWSSVDGGELFTRALFPKSANTPERRYTIVDLDEGEAFVNVQHNSLSSYGTTYGSDSFDREFSEILKYNKRLLNGRVDFRRIFGLEGIYVANRYTNESATVAQTVITYDKGAYWTTLRAPAKDMDGNDIVCDNKACSLHLLGKTDSTKYNHLYSNENAVGLVIANGNVGEALVSDSSKVNTYFSRDAGQTWAQIGKGSHTFEIANHGAITLFAEDSQPTDQLKYSWTQGSTQVSCSFTTQPVQVAGIATEPDNKARTFIVFGTRGGKGVLVHVDFTTAVRECTSDDFEDWSPLGDKCLLGEKFTYQRRKQNQSCGVFRDRQPIVKTEICTCVEEDYECDFCYKPTGARPQLCKKECDDFDPTKEPAECIDTWHETQGYRLVPGNKCDRNSAVSRALEPIQRTCSAVPDNGTSVNPPKGSSELSGGAVFGIILVVLFILGSGLVVAAIILSVTNQQFREMTVKYMPPRLAQLIGGLSAGGSGRAYNASEVRPRASAGYAKVGAPGGSLLDDLDDGNGSNALEEEEEEEEEGSFTSGSSSTSRTSATINGDDDFNPRV